MQERQAIREHCAGLDDAGLVRALTVDRETNSAALIDEASRELDRRGLTVEAVMDRVSVRLGRDRESSVSAAEAAALVNDEVPRGAVAAFTHALGEILILQREAWGWVAHHYEGESYGLSYLLDETDAARALLEAFLGLRDWRAQAGEGHHLDEWEIVVRSEEADDVRALADRLAEAGIPHVLRGPPFTPEGDPTTSLLVPAERREEAMEATGTGRRSVRRLHRLARERDEAGDRNGELAVYEELAETDAGNPAVHYNRGAVLLELGRTEEAAAAFLRCAGRGIERMEASLTPGGGGVGGGGGLGGAVARMMGRLGDVGTRPHFPEYLVDAEMQLLALEERLPQRKELLHGLASIARVKGDAETAGRRYHQILELDPEDEVARFQLGYLRASAD